MEKSLPDELAAPGPPSEQARERSSPPFTIFSEDAVHYTTHRTTSPAVAACKLVQHVRGRRTPPQSSQLRTHT